MSSSDQRNKSRSEETILTSKGLQRTNCIGGDKFEIIFGEKRVECNRFQAAFMSKVIERTLCSDNTINEYEVIGYEGSFEVIEAVSRLMKGFSIVIDDNNCLSLRKLALLLDNDELGSRTIGFELAKEVSTVSNCVSRLRMKAESNCDFEDELEFIASHFYEIESCELEKLKELSADILELVLSSGNLCLNDEDSLVEFISSLGSEGSHLYPYVECRFLSLKGIDTFLSCVSFGEVNSSIWESICRRLRCEVENRDLNVKRFRSGSVAVFRYHEGGEFEGILHHLTKECGGNVHKKGTVNITCSSNAPSSPCNKFWKVADHEWSHYWHSQNYPDSWICFDLKDKQISLQHYTLKSTGNGCRYFIQWEIEGSKDGNTWKNLDNRNTKEMGGNFIVKTYACWNASPSEFFRFIRMRQTGKNSSNNDHLLLCNIEFFGELKSSIVS
jgi:hypothetical protein